MNQHLRCYDYVNHPYTEVRDALARPGVFERATNVAGARAANLQGQLHVRLGPVDVAADVTIHVADAEEGASPLGGPATRLRLEWAAARNPTVFPVMQATLSVYALTATETQLDLEGTYQPPLGLIGRGIDAVVGHRIAEASVLQFVREVAAYLRSELPVPVRSSGDPAAASVTP